MKHCRFTFSAFLDKVVNECAENVEIEQLISLPADPFHSLSYIQVSLYLYAEILEVA